ncbi:MAG: FMN-binding protein [Phycisphaerae bacterium]
MAAAIAVTVAAVCGPSYGDDLELKSGTIYHGRIVSQDSEGVTFEIVRGASKSSMTFPMSVVKRVATSDNYGEDASSSKPAATPSPGLATPSPKAAPTPVPAAGRTPQEVEDIIDKAGRTNPDWWADVKLDYPKSLNMTWRKTGVLDELGMAEYLQDTIKPNPAKWRLGVRVIFETIEVNKADTDRLKQSMEALADAFIMLTGDYARGAWWYRKVGDARVDDRLAYCYWKLGSKSMATDLIAKHPIDASPRGLMIRLLGLMGEPAKATDLAEATAKEGSADVAYLAAGDALRMAGQFNQAVGYYEKLAAMEKVSDAKFKDIARANIDALKAIDGLDMAKLKDGVYTATVTTGHKGDVTVELRVQSGKVSADKVTAQQEDIPLTALTEVPKRIVDKQGIKGVDSVTGATVTSDAIIDASAAALGKARADKTVPIAKTKYKDGTYKGSFRGYKSVIEVTVVIKNDKIQMAVTSQNETPRYYNNAKVVIDKINQAQGTQGVDTVSHATLSSRAIINATNQALDAARNN